jgi:hypothetical protein
MLRKQVETARLDASNAVLKWALDKDPISAKLTLAVLYLGEGSKTRRGAMAFGNSNPEIIRLFLHLLRKTYVIDENRFRVTVQCRADQAIPALEKFWSNITHIPMSQFYKARVDKRTIGVPSRKRDYKGVCKIDYFSASAYHDIMSACRVICIKGR